LNHFVQDFVVKAAGKCSEIGIRMGNNQNAYNTQLTAKVNGTVVFDQAFTRCHQRTSDWMTVFEVKCDRVFAVGEKVELTVATNTNVGMEPILVDNADWPRNTLTGYGSVALRFYVQGTASATTPTPIPAPAPPAPAPPASVPFVPVANTPSLAPPPPDHLSSRSTTSASMTFTSNVQKNGDDGHSSSSQGSRSTTSVELSPTHPSAGQ